MHIKDTWSIETTYVSEHKGVADFSPNFFLYLQSMKSTAYLPYSEC